MQISMENANELCSVCLWIFSELNIFVFSFCLCLDLSTQNLLDVWECVARQMKLKFKNVVYNQNVLIEADIE